MERLYTSKIIKTGTSLALVIPVPVLRGLGFARGDILVFGIYEAGSFSCRRIRHDEIRSLKPADIKYQIIK